MNYLRFFTTLFLFLFDQTKKCYCIDIIETLFHILYMDKSNMKKLSIISIFLGTILPLCADTDVNFVKDIQPILKKHCTTCHNPKKYSGKIDLTEGMGAFLPRSYFVLSQTRQLPPFKFRNNYKILKMIDGSHKKVKLSKKELETIKKWVDAGAPCSTEIKKLADVKVELFDADWAETKAMNKIFENTCASCHNGKKFLPSAISGDTREGKMLNFALDIPKNSPRIRLSAASLFNLSEPKNSAVLCAPLDKRAGGRASKRGHPVIFKNPKDSNYLTILKAIEKAKNFKTK